MSHYCAGLVEYVCCGMRRGSGDRPTMSRIDASVQTSLQFWQLVCQTHPPVWHYHICAISINDFGCTSFLVFLSGFEKMLEITTWKWVSPDCWFELLLVWNIIMWKWVSSDCWFELLLVWNIIMWKWVSPDCWFELLLVWNIIMWKWVSSHCWFELLLVWNIIMWKWVSPEC
jgi:hypothetical protein